MLYRVLCQKETLSTMMKIKFVLTVKGSIYMDGAIGGGSKFWLHKLGGMH